MAHAHAHGVEDDARGHSHSHGAGAGHRRLALALGIGLAIFLAQLIGSALTNSLALLFDSVHVLTDCAGLALALSAAVLAERPSTSHRTWGFKRVEILAAALQASALLGVGVFVAVQALRRFVDPEPVASAELVAFGIVGLVGNAAAILVLAGGRGTSLNLRAAFLEVVNDALGSAAVILSALVMAATGWMQADAVVALLIGVLVMPRAATILRESLSVLLESAPPGLDLDEVRRHIERIEHVVTVHDLHASRISTDLPVLTAHVVLDDSCFSDGHSAELLCRIQHCITEHFEVAITHSTIQLEPRSHWEHEQEGMPL